MLLLSFGLNRLPFPKNLIEEISAIKNEYINFTENEKTRHGWYCQICSEEESRLLNP